jgi:hypothetical protein
VSSRCLAEQADRLDAGKASPGLGERGSGPFPLTETEREHLAALAFRGTL